MFSKLTRYAAPIAYVLKVHSTAKCQSSIIGLIYFQATSVLSVGAFFDTNIQ